MTRISPAALSALLVTTLLALFAGSAHAQFSGGLEGKWQHFVVHVAPETGPTTPAIDVWLDGDLVAWRQRVALAETDLDLPLVWQPGAVVQVPPADAQVSTSVDRPAIKPTVSGAAHLIVEEGLVTALVELRLADGCHKGCAVDGLDVVELGGQAFALDGYAGKGLKTPAARAFPIEPGDLRRTWR